MFYRFNRWTHRVRNLPTATAKVNASRLAWVTMILRMKAAA